MWPTIDGNRMLRGAEADLVRSAIDAVIERVSKSDDTEEPFAYGIDWFDQWELSQKLWLLQQVRTALLSEDSPPRPAAMWEATIDVIFVEVLEQIDQERDTGSRHWREMVSEALQSEVDDADDADDNTRTWRTRVSQLADRILGVASYQKAEAFRDQDPQQLKRFLKQRGLPKDFLEQIPPM